ncbi:hypothetical protein FBU30_001877 [Linnemannia zychae]|nr:hypothetical protein FBU30_001877 [Linnemannia zychae]
MKLPTEGLSKDTMFAYLDGKIAMATSGSIDTLDVRLTPRFQLDNCPKLITPSWTGTVMYPSPKKLTFMTGADFPMIHNWFHKQSGLSIALLQLPFQN